MNWITNIQNKTFVYYKSEKNKFVLIHFAILAQNNKTIQQNINILKKPNIINKYNKYYSVLLFE